MFYLIFLPFWKLYRFVKHEKRNFACGKVWFTAWNHFDSKIQHFGRYCYGLLPRGHLFISKCWGKMKQLPECVRISWVHWNQQKDFCCIEFGLATCHQDLLHLHDNYTEILLHPDHKILLNLSQMMNLLGFQCRFSTYSPFFRLG